MKTTRELLEKNGWQVVQDKRTIIGFEKWIEDLSIYVNFIKETNEIEPFYLDDGDVGCTEVSATQIYKLAEEIKKLEVNNNEN